MSSTQGRVLVNILGISAFYHDSAAALVRDGEIIAAAQEERFSRKKHDSQFPVNAVEYCLQAGPPRTDTALRDRAAFLRDHAQSSWSWPLTYAVTLCML